jgi:hypothetical protein
VKIQKDHNLNNIREKLKTYILLHLLITNSPYLKKIKSSVKKQRNICQMEQPTVDVADVQERTVARLFIARYEIKL